MIDPTIQFIEDLRFAVDRLEENFNKKQQAAKQADEPVVALPRASFTEVQRGLWIQPEGWPMAFIYRWSSEGFSLQFFHYDAQHFGSGWFFPSFKGAVDAYWKELQR